MIAGTLTTLEFPKIREQLARHASFSLGKDRALALLPTSDLQSARRHQAATSEAVDLLERQSDLSVGGARDVRETLRQVEVGGLAAPAAFLDVLATLNASRALKRSIARAPRDEQSYPRLQEVSTDLVDLPALEREIETRIDEHGDIPDSASPNLRRLRDDIRVAHSRLIDRLTHIIHSGEYAQALQEPIITTRGDRYVVPVKADFKGQLRGIVHDQSASGATLFVEPLATVELNNRWRELQLDERREIERILRELGALVGQQGAAIQTAVEALGELDLIFARARYSQALRASEPELVAADAPSDPTRPALSLQVARHPLLGPGAVPISVELGGSFRVLVITGPNTGGKTVALKTIGLLSLMAQAGLHVPAAPGSRLPVFERIYADIGDEQSIEQSLSTFSSHLSHIVRFLEEADPASLVLLDELGAGTDPAEGSALARAILSHLLRRGALVVATTHYSELKAYAYATAGVENASVEFNPETLSPTYRLQVGVPGRSNALAIAARLGLGREVLDEARQLVSPHERQVESMLERIQREQAEAEDLRQAAAGRLRSLESAEDELRERLADLDRLRAETVAEARAEVERQLQDVLADLARVRGRIDTARTEPGWVEEAAVALREHTRAVRRLPRPRARPPAEAVGQPRRPPRVGDRVVVGSLQQEGVLVGLEEPDLAEVQVGSFKLRVPRQDLRRSGKPDVPEPTPVTLPPAPAAPPLEIDFRGQRADEALDELERYLNDAYLAGLQRVRIIHGKGTGTLRRLVRERLERHPLVESFAPGERNEGGDGVTIATLGRR